MRKCIQKVKRAWKGLSFCVYLVTGWAATATFARYGFIFPRMAFWEIAAMAHVFTLAWELMDFDGFLYVSRRFNSQVKKFVLVAIAILFFSDVVLVVLQIQRADPGSRQKYPLVEFIGQRGLPLKHVTPYISIASSGLMVLPILLFAIVNLTALLWVKRESARLGLYDTQQEKDLRAIFRAVDLPPIGMLVIAGIFIIPFTCYGSSIETFELSVTIISCTTLVVSNYLAVWRVKEGGNAALERLSYVSFAERYNLRP